MLSLPVRCLPSLLVLAMIAVTGCGPAQELEIRLDASIVSSRPDLVTGGDMLVSGLDPDMGLEVNGEPVNVSMRGSLALIEGLPPGEHELVGYLDAQEILRLPFTNHPAQGPVISGPHQAPYFCETDSFEVTPAGDTLPKAEPPLCVVPRRSDPVSLGDIEATVETGVINRAIYQIAVPAGWNGKLIYHFGGGCRAGWYRQGARTGGVFEPHLLGEGYAVASASLNVFGVNCNDLLAAETMMMVKERFIEANGVPRLTIGFGCSGGSYQAHQIADNYPGLLDGILVGCSFPEVGHAMVTSLADTRLLKRYFDWANAAGDVTWSTADKLAVTGLPSEASIDTLAAGASRIVSVQLDGWAAAEFAEVVPADARFDPEGNPGGARPTVFDHTVNVYGRDPETGYARWPYDNRGIQYGLVAFRAGDITAEQFLHLNEHIGGFDRNGRFQPARTAHDPAATRMAYRTGRILDGGFGLNEIPIIDYRAWTDDRVTGDTHLEYHTYSTRARLVAANGDADNHVILTEDGLCEGCSLFSLDSDVLSRALAQLDAWIVAIDNDTAIGNEANRVRRNKPESLVDACWIEGEKVVEPQQMQGGRCNDVFPTFGYARLMAGTPIENNIVACTRRSPAADDVAGLESVDAVRFRKIFASGVCDWSEPGEAQERLATTWWKAPIPAGAP